MTAPMSSERGPLPKFKRTAVLERLSIQALQSTLPPDRFLFRGEPGEDAGVDGELEILYDSEFANCRAKVQLKATDLGDVNNDGSVSLSVDTSNLNYLLNGPSPIYVLYIDPRKELRFAWAWDELRRIEEEKPDWKSQATITLRFREILDPPALVAIHEMIAREARFNRQIAETLGRSGDTQTVTIHINPETLDITDPANIKQMLLRSGISIVAAGHSPRVVELVSLLGPADVRLPSIQLILAYALYNQSRIHSAYGHLQEAMLQQADLSEEDRDFLIFLRDACDYETGKITLAEYVDRKNKWTERARSQFALIHHLECLGHELISDLQSDRVPSIIEQIKTTVEAISADVRSSETIKLQARLTAQYAEGVQLIRLFTDEITICHIGVMLGNTRTPLSDMKYIWERFVEWENSIDISFHQALEIDHYRILGDVAISRAIVRFMYLTNMRMAALPGKLLDLPKGYVEMATTDARMAAGFYDKCGSLLGQLRAKMLLADYLELAGNHEEAKTLAASIHPVAQAMGFTSIGDYLADQAVGRSMQKKIEERVALQRTIDSDEATYDATDDEMHQFALAMIRSLKLPDDRLPIVLQECSAMRDEANEKWNWCRHFNLGYALNLDPLTYNKFLTVPERFAHCDKHHIRARHGNTSARDSIAEFKYHVCANCPDRNPKKPT